MQSPDANRSVGPAGKGAVWWAIAGIVLCAAAFRLALANYSLWFDEQASVFFSDQPFRVLWSDWIVRETNPPLYYSLLRLWRFGGSSDLYIRMLSILGSIAAIAALAEVARRLYGPRAAIVAAVLASLSGQHLYYALQARAYIFVYLAAVVAIGAVARHLALGVEGRRRTLGPLAIYAIAAIAAVHLHATMLLFPAFVFVSAAVVSAGRVRRDAMALAPLLIATALVYACSAWAIRIALIQVFSNASNIAPIGLVGAGHILDYAVKTLFLGAHGGRLTYLLCGATIAGTVWLLGRDRRAETRFLAVLALLSVVMLGVIGTRVPVFVPRTIFWISAPLTLLLAGAIAFLPRRWLRIGLTALLGFAATIDLVKSLPALRKEDWNAPVRAIARHPDAVLLVHGEAMAILADNVCRRRTGRAVCPYPIVAAMDPGDRYDTWARGLFAGPRVPFRALPAYAGDRRVFLFRKADHHNLVEVLQRSGMGKGLPADAGPFIGPFDAAALR